MTLVMVRSRAVYASLWNIMTTDVVGNSLGYDRPAHLANEIDFMSITNISNH